ncbi:coiled-coil domain-containing protein 40 [Eucyclogobius newberryi]|uniref:coiled-coil domain-containing protein 40 n=1 Tax=Eucyclogobius newberryi TaxID=166745 RepID=UPI003B5A7EEA
MCSSYTGSLRLLSNGAETETQRRHNRRGMNGVSIQWRAQLRQKCLSEVMDALSGTPQTQSQSPGTPQTQSPGTPQTQTQTPEDMAPDPASPDPASPVPASPDLSETMQDPGPPVNNYDDDDDEEEFVVLGPDHELVKRHQAALNVQLNKELERINSGLKEKLALERAHESEIEDASMEIYRMNQNLVRLQYKLDNLHQTKAEAENKHLQTIEQLETNKSQFSSTTNQHKQTNANVSQLQSEIDSLMRNLTFTQEVSDKLHSDIKAMRNATQKAEVEKFQAEEQKLKQDLYVERLTKDMERLTEQVDLYIAQTCAQAEETQAAKQALSEAEMEMASLLMARKQLLQQWNSSLVGMRRRGEAFTAMQEAELMLEHQLLSLDRDIKGYVKTITAEQEQNETLTMQLNRAEMDNSTTRSQINQRQAQQEALQTHYSTSLCTLRETERTLAQLTKETCNFEAEVKDQRRQMEKESALRLELEDRIVSAMQQSLTHNKAAKSSQKLSQKLTLRKKEKITQLWQLENDILAAELESSEIGQNLDNLAFTQKALDDETAKMDKMLSDQTGNKSSFMFLIGQKQSIIIKLKKKIDQIAAATGSQDLSPLQIKADAIKTQTEELEGSKNRDHRLWITRQGALVGLMQELENTNKNMVQLQTENTCMQQERIRLRNLIEGEHRDEQDLQKNTQALRRDLTRFNTLLRTNFQLSQTLEQDNALMQTDFTKKLQARHSTHAELESIKMKMKWEKTAEEKERLFNCLVEAERQIMLWEKKIQMVKETYSTVQGEEEQAEVRRMKAEIHRMEVRLTQLMKERERLLSESEATVARRETIVLRRESLLHRSPNRESTRGELQRLTQSLQRKISTTHKQVTECEQVIRELQESQVDVGSRLSQQKQQLIDLCGDSFALEQDSAKLQDTKDKNLSRLVVLQNRSKKLQSVKDNSYKPASSGQSIAAALQSQTERVHTTSTILHRLGQDLPQHQGALRRLTLALGAQAQEKVPELDIRVGDGPRSRTHPRPHPRPRTHPRPCTHPRTHPRPCTHPRPRLCTRPHPRLCTPRSA